MKQLKDFVCIMVQQQFLHFSWVLQEKFVLIIFDKHQTVSFKWFQGYTFCVYIFIYTICMGIQSFYFGIHSVYVLLFNLNLTSSNWGHSKNCIQQVR